jgi:hypothetical protein
MGDVDLPQKNTSRLKTDMDKAHQNKKKTAEPESKTYALAIRKKINTVNRKQYSNPITAQLPHLIM